MKRIIYLLLLTLTTWSYAQNQPILTMVAHGGENGGVPKVVEIYAHGTVDFSEYNLEKQVNANTNWQDMGSLAALGTVTDDFVYVYKEDTNNEFALNYPSVASAQALELTGLSLNGDDRVRIVKTSTGDVIDIFGEDGVDGTGTAWEYKKGYAKRKDGTGPDVPFVVANWDVFKLALKDEGYIVSGTTHESIMGGVGTYQPATTATCDAPSNGQASNITDTSAQLSWTPGGNETAWNIEYGMAGFTQGQGTTVNVMNNPEYSLTGLNPATDYEWYVQADCGNGDTSDWAGPYSFTTLPAPCDAPTNGVANNITDTSAELSWDFTGIAELWNLEYSDQSFTPGTGAGTTVNPVGPPVSLTGLNPGTTYYWYVQADCGTGSPSDWAGPFSFTTSAATTTCDAPSNGQASNITDTSAQLSWTPGGNETAWNIEYGMAGFTQGQGMTVNANTNPYTLTGLTPGADYEFYVQADCGNGDTSDWAGPFSFTTTAATTTCDAPSNGQASNITDTSAQLSWTPGGNETAWNIEYGMAGFTQGQGMTVNVTSNPYTLTGLSPATDYEWYIQADCGNGSTRDTSDWAGPFSFTTLPANNTCVFTPSYTQDFTNFLPTCWEEARGNPGNLTYQNYRWTNDGFLNQGTTGAARIYMYGIETHINDWLISPRFDFSAGSNFYVSGEVGVTSFSNSNGASMGTDDFVRLLVSTDGGNTWSVLNEWNASNNPSSAGDHFAYDVSSYAGNTNVKFAFYANTGTTEQSGYNFYLDDFVIDAAFCEPPSNLNRTITGETSVILSWDDNSGGTSTYLVEWKAQGASSWSSVTTAAGATSHTLTGLTPDMEYQWRVTGECTNNVTSVPVYGPSFIPTCISIVPDYLQEFTTYLDNCWSEGKGNMTSYNVSDYRWTYDGFANNGTTGAARVVMYANSFDAWLISPEFDLSGGAYTLSMDVAVTKFSTMQASPMGTDDEVNLKISTDGGATWTLLHTWTNSNAPSNTGDTVNIPLNNYSGMAMFALVASDGSVADFAYNFYVDNFAISASPSNKPASPVVNNYDIRIGQVQNTYKLTALDNEIMLNVTAYDLSGREIYSAENVNSDYLDSLINVSSGSIIIFRIEMADHTIVTKKAIKR